MAYQPPPKKKKSKVQELLSVTMLPWEAGDILTGDIAPGPGFQELLHGGTLPARPVAPAPERTIGAARDVPRTTVDKYLTDIALKPMTAGQTRLGSAIDALGVGNRMGAAAVRSALGPATFREEYAGQNARLGRAR